MHYTGQFYYCQHIIWITQGVPLIPMILQIIQFTSNGAYSNLKMCMIWHMSFAHWLVSLMKWFTPCLILSSKIWGPIPSNYYSCDFKLLVIAKKKRDMDKSLHLVNLNFNMSTYWGTSIWIVMDLEVSSREITLRGSQSGSSHHVQPRITCHHTIIYRNNMVNSWLSTHYWMSHTAWQTKRIWM